MLCLHMHVEVFLIILSLFANLKLMSVFTHETLLICRLGTFKNCKEVKQIMVMIIATIYIFLSENWFQKIFKASWKNPLPLFTHSLPLKIQKVQVPYLFANIENFSAPPPPPFPPKKRGRTIWSYSFQCFVCDICYMSDHESVMKVCLIILERYSLQV